MITDVALEVSDVAAAEAFYAAAFDLKIGLREGTHPRFRGFTMSLVVAQPGTVDSLAASALEAGATVVKPVTKSFWGYGGIVRAPDGIYWKLASSAKKDTAPVTREIDDVVILLGCDVAAAKKFWVERGLKVGKSFGSKYVEFDTPGSPVKLALYGTKALAKEAGVAQDGWDSPGIALTVDGKEVTVPLHY